MKDLDLGKLARSSAKLKAEIDDLTRQQSKIREQIKEEMINRGVDAIEIQGVRIKLVQPESVVLNIEELKKRRPKLYTSCLIEIFSQDKLAEAVQKGRVSTEFLNSCSSIQPRTSYPTISLIK